ncbi:MAG: IgGFc-binding protein, partial [Sediminibacterium sp.]
MTYAFGSISETRSHSHFMIIALEDSTTIKISPSQVSSLGTSAIPFKIKLNQGETYVYQAFQDLDLTGSIIHAEDCKKVAVYDGARLTFIPISCSNAKGGNMLNQQAAPINTLGTVFLISPAPNVEKELFKIVATQNNTNVFVNGILVSVLAKGGIYESYFSQATFIKTNKPVITAYFGISWCGTAQKNGGPFMVLVTPFEQAIKTASVIIKSFPSENNVNKFIQIHVRSKDANLTFLNGQNIGSKFKTFPTQPEYAYAQIPVDSGLYKIQNKYGFTAEVNSNGTTNIINGYGYSAGSLLNKSNQYASVNGNSSNLQKEFLFCPMQAVNFEAVRQDTVFSKVFWHFDDGSIDSGNVVNKTFKDTGCHQVQMISYYSGSSGNCLLGNGTTDTTFLKVCVVNSLPLSIGNDTGFCRNRPLTLQSNINPDGFSYLWSNGATSSAISVSETGNYWLELKNGNCAIRDSVQVTVVDKPVLSIQGDKLLCSGDSILLQNSVNSPTVTYTWNNGKKGYSQWINKPGLYSLSGIDRGCYAETSINIGELSCPEIYVP